MPSCLLHQFNEKLVQYQAAQACCHIVSGQKTAGAVGAGLAHYASKSAESYCERPGLITAGSSVKIQI